MERIKFLKNNDDYRLAEHAAQRCKPLRVIANGITTFRINHRCALTNPDNYKSSVKNPAKTRRGADYTKNVSRAAYQLRRPKSWTMKNQCARSIKEIFTYLT
ncbi:hypothetical protein CHS0354_027226, partial [Potamilus streckersoni]